MEIVSLIIMAVGLAALVGIYILSRISRQDAPRRRKLPPINTLKDDDGTEVTSIMDDQPARDGKTPTANAQDLSDVMSADDGVISAARPVSPSAVAASAHATSIQEDSYADIEDAEYVGETQAYTDRTDKPANPEMPPQLIMFIAADNDEGFAGPKIMEALDNSGLTFGEMDVYHRIVLSVEGESSLFNVANGIKPWTLIPEELEQGMSTPGLSMVLNLPSPISDSEAIHDFVRTAERITSHLGGVLKNQQQEVITAEERRAYFNMF